MAQNEPTIGPPVALPMPQPEQYPAATPYGYSNEPALPDKSTSGMVDQAPPTYQAATYPSAGYPVPEFPVNSKMQAPGDYPAAGTYPQEQTQPFIPTPSQRVVIVTQPMAGAEQERIPPKEPVIAIVFATFVTICCCFCIGIPALIIAVVALCQSTVAQSKRYVKISIRVSIAGVVIGLILIGLRIAMAFLQPEEKEYDGYTP